MDISAIISTEAWSISVAGVVGAMVVILCVSAQGGWCLTRRGGDAGEAR